jgi:transcriptional repressor OPI1
MLLLDDQLTHVIDFYRHPASHSKASLMPLTRDDTAVSSPEAMIEDEDEPLLSLITSTHPWIGGTISGSLYAYNSTMHYSPQWIQSVVDKNLQSVASGLGSASRVTGLESRVRQYLGDTPERKTTRASNKRQRESTADQMDIERGYTVSPTHSRQRSRTGSQASFDTLPAYDADRAAPEYEKQISAVQLGSQAWSTRLMITTSGLGAALNDKSLKSLKYCLSLLRMATDSLAEIMNALRSLIADYEKTFFGSQAYRSGAQLTQEQEFASHNIADRIKTLGNSIMGILFEVTSNISQYAGDALPENASALVRRQLMSVPQRWKLAEEKTSTPPSESTTLGGNNTSDAVEKHGEVTMRAGRRWLVFAEQGCDMITQISLVVSGTVESAENWLDSMGRRRESVMSEKTAMSINAPP